MRKKYSHHRCANAFAVGTVFVALLFASASASWAFPSGGHRTSAFDGTSFTSACVGHNFQGFGIGGNLGTDLSTHGFLNAGNGAANCNAATSTGVGTVNSSAADGGPIGSLGGSYSGTAAGEARAGVIKIQSSKTSSSSQRFTGAAANGGWNDSYTVTGGTGQGLWVIPIQVTGTVNAQGAGTTAIIQLMPYVNRSFIDGSPAQHAAALGEYRSRNQQNNGDVISASGFQISSWGAVNHGAGDPLIQFAVNEIVELVIPVTYGLSVDLGIYASVLSGERAQGAGDGLSETLFQNTVTWLGPGFVIGWDAANGLGDVNNNIGITAASGVDYTRSFATEVAAPGMAGLFTTVIFGLGLARRKHRIAMKSGPGNVRHKGAD